MVMKKDGIIISSYAQNLSVYKQITNLSNKIGVTLKCSIWSGSIGCY